MKHERPKTGKAGETSQWPSWEGPAENRPSGYIQGESDIFQEDGKETDAQPAKRTDQQ
jgi:hypothetical protein